MGFLQEHWAVLLAGLALIGGAGLLGMKFFFLPSDEQIRKVKEWLLLACIEAEQVLGSGTGVLKLRYVYDKFIERFPAVSGMISFDTFSTWVDVALEEMRALLEESEPVRVLVEEGELQ